MNQHNKSQSACPEVHPTQSGPTLATLAGITSVELTHLHDVIDALRALCRPVCDDRPTPCANPSEDSSAWPEVIALQHTSYLRIIDARERLEDLCQRLRIS